MKKKLLLFIFLWLCLLPLYVKAASCDTVQCITCSYSINGIYSVTYSVVASGTGSATFTRNAEKIDETNRAVYNFTDAENPVRPDNFINSNASKLTCPSTIYVKYDGGASATVGVALSFTQFSNSAANFSIDNSTDNGKPFLLNASQELPKSCTYSGNIGTRNVTTATITRENDQLNYEFTNGYQKASSGNDVAVEDFPTSATGTCPTVYVNCGGDGDNKFCTITKNASIFESSSTEQEIATTEPSSSTPSNGGEFITGDIDCSIFNGDFGKILKQVLDITRFAGPVLTIVLSIMDYIKALASQSQEDIKKANGRFIKRLIISVLIFIVPTLLEILLNWAGNAYGVCALG